MTDTLLAFLRARLDEDAADAQRAAEELGARWRYDGQHVVAEAEGDMVATGSLDELEAERGAHVARHDPARVLAEVEAKRQLVLLHGRATLRAGGGAQHFDTTTVCRSCEPSYQFPDQSWPCPTLRLLALPYAGHPDYREEWRP